MPGYVSRDSWFHLPPGGSRTVRLVPEPGSGAPIAEGPGAGAQLRNAGVRHLLTAAHGPCGTPELPVVQGVVRHSSIGGSGAGRRTGDPMRGDAPRPGRERDPAPGQERAGRLAWRFVRTR